MRVELSLEGNASLKGKRKVVKSILGRVRARFNCAAAEVEDNDLHQHAVLGFTLVANDRRFLNSAMDKVAGFIEDNVDAAVSGMEMEIFNVF